MLPSYPWLKMSNLGTNRYLVHQTYKALSKFLHSLEAALNILYLQNICLDQGKKWLVHTVNGANMWRSHGSHKAM